MKKFAMTGLSAFALLASACTTHQKSAASEVPTAIPLESMTPAQALQRLKDGNQRFTAGNASWSSDVDLMPHEQGQNPYAIILSCADSRVAVEHIFDAGKGELFVLRVAGNVATSEMIGSAEYAVAALGTPLFVVMGHEACGAVGGALAVEPGMFPQDLESLLVEIRADLEAQGAASAPIEEAVPANVRQQMATLMEVPAFSDAVAAGELMIVGATYDIGSGEVVFMN